MTSLPPWLGALWVALAWVFIVSMFFRSMRRSRVRPADLARALEGTARRNVVTFVRDGREYRCECFPGGRHSRPWVAVRTDSAPGVRYSAVPARASASRFRHFGRGAVVAIADPTLAEAITVYSDDGIAASAFFATEDRRRALRDFAALGAMELEQDEVQIGVRWSGARDTSDVVTTLVPSAIHVLGALASGTPTAEGRAAVRRRRVAASAVSLALLAGLAAAFVLSGVARERFAVLDWFDLLLASLWYSVPLAVAVTLVVTRADVMRRALTPVVVLGPFVVVPSLVLQLAIVANGFLDDGPPTAHDTRVLRIVLEAGRDAHGEAVVASWRDRREERFDVTRNGAARLRPGAAIRVVTRPGWLGYEWIAAWSPSGAAS